MSTDRDTTRIVRSWLRRDEHESADRVLDNVFALLDVTPQRRSWWPARRIDDMNAFAKLATAAAALVVVAVAGIMLLPASGGVGGPSGSPSPSAAPSLTPSPSAAPGSAVFPRRAELPIGRHTMTREGVTFSISVPTSGWFSDGDFRITRGAGPTPGGTFIFWGSTPDGVYADPCGDAQSPSVGQSVADLAAAVASVPGTDATEPSDIVVDGRPGKRVQLTIPENADCNARTFMLWYDEEIGGRWPDLLGSTMTVWIIEAPGSTSSIWIDGETYKGATPELQQQMQQIVDSIEFE